jgi:hypothetical protein
VFIFRPVALHAYADWCRAAKTLAQEQQATLFAFQFFQ